jgi:hypothetical protein
MTASLASCALGGLTSGGASCFGPFCPRSEEAVRSSRDQIFITLRYWTKFEKSIDPSVDNLFERLKRNPADREIGELIDSFVKPAVEVYSTYFNSAFSIKRSIDQTNQKLLFELAQRDWQISKKGDSNFQRFGDIASGSASFLRWKANSKAEISRPIGSRLVYAVATDISLESAENQDGPFVGAATLDVPRIREFAQSLFSRISSSYVRYIKNTYNIDVAIQSESELLYQEILDRPNPAKK